MTKVLCMFVLIMNFSYGMGLDDFETSYSDLLAAKSAGEDIFVAFTEKNCETCNVFKREVIGTDRFITEAEIYGIRYFHIDVDLNPGALAEWGGGSAPHWFILQEGHVIYELSGYYSGEHEIIYDIFNDFF